MTKQQETDCRYLLDCSPLHLLVVRLFRSHIRKFVTTLLLRAHERGYLSAEAGRELDEACERMLTGSVARIPKATRVEDWVKHRAGDPQPVPSGTIVYVKLRGGYQIARQLRAESLYWGTYPQGMGEIIAYKVVYEVGGNAG